MVSLLQETLHELHCQPAAPSKDFHRLATTSAEVIWSTWRISFQTSHEKVFPKEVKKLHAEFLLDQQLQSKYCTSKQRIHKVLEAISALVNKAFLYWWVRNVFGNNTLEYTVHFCQGHYDFLVRMPKDIIVHILLFLDADDLQQLSKTCKKSQQ
ncbi:PREDICTED: F-box only protein 36-like, partial [Phaethon lepturus]|uniref:F-box only protein 36-like n=1 Tax=Phaethon lepturus TaxID=97097 RepID=UPI000530819D